ncbi:MAG: WxL domain-containing protein [Streptococcaceae bacterium]|nr:WxL domain-containing protein [Streptococcaceae bacterium]
MKKALLLSVPLLFGAVALPSVAQASSYSSYGEVGFYAGEGITPPVNPNTPDPNVPVSPQNPDGSKPQPGTSGPLSIDFASSFDFGTHPISNQDETYLAKAQHYFDDTMVTPDYVQVTDARGSLEGWTLRLIQNGQLKEEGSGKYPELNGATLSLTHPVARSNGDSLAPEVREVMGLTPDSEVVVAVASIGHGAGTWAIRWGEQEDLIEQEGEVLTPNVQLFVPGTTGKDAAAYKTTLTWILSNLPS